MCSLKHCQELVHHKMVSMKYIEIKIDLRYSLLHNINKIYIARINTYSLLFLNSGNSIRDSRKDLCSPAHDRLQRSKQEVVCQEKEFENTRQTIDNFKHSWNIFQFLKGTFDSLQIGIWLTNIRYLHFCSNY